MASIVFPYKPMEGTFQPIISVGIRFQNSWQPLRFYVDSGAAYSILRANIADELDFDYRQGNRVYLQVGSGSLILVYVNQLEIQIGSERFFCRIGFSEQLGVRFNVLGRADIFNRFKICFQEHQRLLTFEPIQVF